MTAPWRRMTVDVILMSFNHAEYLLFLRSMTKWRLFFKIISDRKVGPAHYPVPCLMPVMDWQCVVAILAGALDFREHCSWLGGAYLCKSKTAEYEFESDAPEVRFDTSQAGFRYFCVTFCTHFVTVWTVAMQCYKPIDQLVIIPSVTTWVVFRKAVLKARGQVKPLACALSL